MFTGLIEDVGQVVKSVALPSGKGRRLTVEAPLLREQLGLGDSLCTDGVCLTVVAWRSGQAELDVGPETLSVTTLGSHAPSQRVNLERALRLSDRLGGHLVSGHVDGTGEIVSRAQRGEALDIEFSVPAPLSRYVVKKGSIAVDGISLTVNEVAADRVTVSLIPHTQVKTTLPDKQVGSKVNLEVDMIAKYVERLLAGHLPGGLTLSKLKEHGFAQSE